MGRKSGRRYTIPVAYTRDKDDLLIGTPFGWGRNLRTGEPVEIRLKGRLRQADVRVYSGEADVTGAYADHVPRQQAVREVQQDRVRRRGNPDPEDLHLAWMAGAPRLPADPGADGEATGAREKGSRRVPGAAVARPAQPVA